MNVIRQSYKQVEQNTVTSFSTGVTETLGLIAPPPCILKALTVHTKTMVLGKRPEYLVLMLKNFSIPIKKIHSEFQICSLS